MLRCSLEILINYFTLIQGEKVTSLLSLTRYAINIPNYLVWMKDVPPQFLSIVQADLDGLS